MIVVPKAQPSKSVKRVQRELRVLFYRKSQKLIASITYGLIKERVGITERDLSQCFGKVPTLQQLLVQR